MAKAAHFIFYESELQFVHYCRRHPRNKVGEHENSLVEHFVVTFISLSPPTQHVVALCNHCESKAHLTFPSLSANVFPLLANRKRIGHACPEVFPLENAKIMMSGVGSKTRDKKAARGDKRIKLRLTKARQGTAKCFNYKTREPVFSIIL